MLTTGPWRGPDWVPGEDRRALDLAVSAGWQVRAASAKWYMVWQAEQDVLRSLKVIVMPGRDAGLSDDEIMALLRDRLCTAGLTSQEPDALDLALARRRCIAALLSGWRSAAGHP